MDLCAARGALALGVSDATVRVWSLGDLQEQIIFRGHGKALPPPFFPTPPPPQPMARRGCHSPCG